MATFTNQAQLTYNDSITNSNVAVGEILEVLSAAKTAVQEDYGANDAVTYIISVVNTGNTAFTGITLTDNLGAYTFNSTAAAATVVPLTYTADTVRYYVNGALQAAPAVTAGPPLVISNLTIPADGNATIIYEAQTNRFAPPGVEGTITNTATISGGNITPVTVTESVAAKSGPVLSITKSVIPVPVTENGTLTYTFVIQNSGNTAADAGDNAVITDTFSPILSGLTVTFNGAAWAEGTNYTYSEVNGLFTTQAGQIIVPAATYTQDPATGAWITNPGTSTLVVSGTV